MKRSLEQAWREISTELDEVLDLEPPARRVWLAGLEVTDPERAQRVRAYIADLDKLESDNFLGRDLPAVLAVNTSLAGRNAPRRRRPAIRRRVSTAAALAEDLRRHLRNEPILARSHSTWYRARKFLLRNRFPVLAAGAIVFALIAALGMALWQAHVARERAVPILPAVPPVMSSRPEI